MALLPTPPSMPFAINGNLFAVPEYRPHQPQLFLQPYLPLNGDRSFGHNYYLVVVPLISSPSTLAHHFISAAMSTSTILQASTLLNSLLSTSYVNRYTPPPSSMASHIRQQYRFNFRPGYR